MVVVARMKEYCKAKTCNGCNSLHLVGDSKSRYCYDDKFQLPGLDSRERYSKNYKNYHVMNNIIGESVIEDNFIDLFESIGHKDKCLHCLNEVYNTLATRKKTFRVSRSIFIDVFISTAKEMLSETKGDIN